MNNKRDKAIGYFSAKMHCSQSVLAAFSGECGISEEQAFRLENELKKQVERRI